MRDRAVAKEYIANLAPERLVAAAAGHSLERFVAIVGSSVVLLVQLDARDSEIAQALLDASAAPTEALRAGDGLAFGTTVGSPLSVPHSRRYGAPLDVTGLQSMLLKGPYFVAPLVKRIVAGKPFSERISVGRARNNDIVLRHTSVSKFHAWFELGEAEDLRLGDARSTNRTRLNGRALARDLEPVTPGDQIVFGSVRTTLCATDLLCEALRG